MSANLRNTFCKQSSSKLIHENHNMLTLFSYIMRFFTLHVIFYIFLIMFVTLPLNSVLANYIFACSLTIGGSTFCHIYSVWVC